MEKLVAAVRRGDPDEVRALLESGADPDTLAEGFPVLCLAMAAYDEPVAEALIESGAAPLRRLPDGVTPLLRAVDSGSTGLTIAVMPEPVELRPADREELLERARHWTRTGAEAELRRRTGATGEAERTRVEDRIRRCHYDRLTLGGLTTRDGHAAVLSRLEADFGIRTPFGELLARALVRPDRGHAVWSEAVSTLGRRRDEDTWTAAVALSRAFDRVHRLFAADVLLALHVGDAFGHVPFDGRGQEVFLPWAAEEQDPEVLAAVLNGLTEEDGPQIEAMGLSYRAHPHPVVRALVLEALERGEDRLLVRPANLATVFALARDPDERVRRNACEWLAHYPERSPEIGDALAALTHDPLQAVRAHAVYGLAEHDDPRCVEGDRRIGPVDPDGPWYDDWVLGATRRYEWRREDAAEGS
ncbi:HEAT repeat domain-containing protein [Streptomyces koelreuteriae]|uniref:HEAT repeat domain-containing protein n=1 Tax=Streptomyces koelreuteriae TaxID=2838015 RepID=UPI003EBC00E2